MRVKLIMTSGELKYCNPETKVEEAGSMMKYCDLGVLPVLDDMQKVIGFVTNHDITTSLKKIPSQLTADMRVSEIMINKIYTVNSNDSTSSALHYMVSNRIGRVPVIDSNGKMEGIISIFKLITYNNNRRRLRKIASASKRELSGSK